MTVADVLEIILKRVVIYFRELSHLPVEIMERPEET
jgi:hypothetical protein